VACGQVPLPVFGNYSPGEIFLKECVFDKDAGAVILLDEASSHPGIQGELFTHRRIRIKIFNKRELDRANISIRYITHDDFESVDSIKGVTFNLEDGQYVLTSLDKESIFRNKIDDYYSEVKFAMPAVKEGSIIEYEYNSIKKNYSGLRSWSFQNDIPTIRSCFMLQILLFTQFKYGVQRKPNYPITIKELERPERIYFEMKNIPGLKTEPYMDARKDYLQRVEFQLASYMTEYGQTAVNQTWKNLVTNLIDDKDFGGAIKKELPHTEDIKEIVAKETTDSGKIAVVYNYVRDHFNWNGYSSLFASNGLKDPWEKKSGSAGEINLILVNLLRLFKIEVYPLLVAERDYGKIDVQFPFLDRFNKVVAYAKTDKRIFIMDATQKYCPADLPPFPLLNTIGFIVDRKEFRHIGILNKGYKYDNKITVDATMDINGVVKGTARIVSTGYAKQLRTENIKKDRRKFVAEILQEPGTELKIDDFDFENLDDESKPLIQTVNFHNDLNVSGGFVFFIYNLFTGLARNPFTASERFTNINFGYPYNINAVITLQLPPNIKIDKLPEDKSVASTDVSTVAYRSLKSENSTLVINIGFRQSNSMVSFEQYTDTKSLYTEITGMLNEPLVIKIGQ